jgi:hypothetical protein
MRWPAYLRVLPAPFERTTASLGRFLGTKKGRKGIATRLVIITRTSPPSFDTHTFYSTLTRCALLYSEKLGSCLDQQSTIPTSFPVPIPKDWARLAIFCVLRSTFGFNRDKLNNYLLLCTLRLEYTPSRPASFRYPSQHRDRYNTLLNAVTPLDSPAATLPSSRVSSRRQ